tara:strand:- start:365 stop:1453 length:1089 start_codon:yes stop_codon:yes gene_type:complete
MNSIADKNLFLNENSECNHCQRYDSLVESRIFSDQGKSLSKLVEKIKNAGKNKDFDCIVGVSGGVDSTYLAYIAKKLGLRPLAVHFDNGWNSELAIKNIEKVLKKLKIELYTYVVEWEEFRDLQLSFLEAAVPDGEIPTDHAISALLWKTASKFKIKYILSGLNFATEAVSVPDWSYGHSDWKYIKSVHKKFGIKKLKTFPHFNFFELFYINFIKDVRSVSILNYLDYNKKTAMDLLTNELDWTQYEGKHYESFYTKFYQGYVLPTQFNIDKRYGHLSDLINSKQISRDQAIDEIQKPSYDHNSIEADKEYVAKKFNISKEKLEKILSLKPSSFRDYPNSYDLVQFARNSVNFLRKYNLYPK